MSTFKTLLAIYLAIAFNVFLPVMSVYNDNYIVADDLLYKTFPFIKPPPEVLESWEYSSDKGLFETMFRNIIKYEYGTYIPDSPYKWTDAIDEITNEWVQIYGFTKLAYLSREDNNYKFNTVLGKMLDAHWPLDTLTDILIKNKNYKMLTEFLERGWQFHESHLRFVKEAFEIGRKYYDTGDKYYVADLCLKMVEKKVIIKGMEEAAIDFLMRPGMRTNSNRTDYLKELLSRPINPDKKSSEAVLQLIRNEQYEWAVMLLEKGWPLRNLTPQDLQQIRESDHRGIRKVLPGILALFQKPI